MLVVTCRGPGRVEPLLSESEAVSDCQSQSNTITGTAGNLRNPKVLNTIIASYSLIHTIMSRFFRQAVDSDSESSDSEESLLSSDEDASPAKTAAPAKPAMSRFLRTANASDSSSSSSESELEDEDDSDDAQKEAKPKSRFLRDSDEEESDEDVKRVVKSARDKRLEEMEATGKTMDNALKINDWIAISSGV